MNLILRRATASDSRFLFDLRNEESVRRVSGNPDPIRFETHTEWFAIKLARNESVILIAEADNKAMATIRFDFADAENAHISIALMREYRGRGYGTEIIKKTTAHFLAKHPRVASVRAYINAGNEPSLRSFTKAGYEMKDMSEKDGLRRHILVFSRQPIATP